MPKAKRDLIEMIRLITYERYYDSLYCTRNLKTQFLTSKELLILTRNLASELSERNYFLKYRRDLISGKKSCILLPEEW